MRVLLAEDDVSTRAFFARALSLCGHEVTICADGREALAAWLEEPFPLVVADWMMPEMHGLELCERIRATPGGERAFILVVTAYDDPTLLAQALAVGVDDWIAKPVGMTQLHARLMIAAKRIALEEERRAAEASARRGARGLAELFSAADGAPDVEGPLWELAPVSSR